MSKRCKHCASTKDIDQFPIPNQARCRDCGNAQRRIVWALKRTHVAACDQVCEICLRLGQRLCLDHDHTTGDFRGWLCGSCNRGLGHFGDSLEMMRRAVAYLDVASPES